MTDVTRILRKIEQGDAAAAEQLLPLVYEELKRLAATKLAKEKPGQTLQATALVHEAYLRLVDNGSGKQWDSRGHFFAAAAQSMRRILIDNARRKSSKKAGGGLVRQPLIDSDAIAESPNEQLLALDEALTELSEGEPVIGELVLLRYFSGLSIDQAAQALNISPRTAKRYWVYAKAWLTRRMGAD